MWGQEKKSAQQHNFDKTKIAKKKSLKNILCPEMKPVDDKIFRKIISGLEQTYQYKNFILETNKNKTHFKLMTRLKKKLFRLFNKGNLLLFNLKDE